MRSSSNQEQIRPRSASPVTLALHIDSSSQVVQYLAPHVPKLVYVNAQGQTKSMTELEITPFLTREYYTFLDWADELVPDRIAVRSADGLSIFATPVCSMMVFQVEVDTDNLMRTFSDEVEPQVDALRAALSALAPLARLSKPRHSDLRASFELNSRLPHRARATAMCARTRAHTQRAACILLTGCRQWGP